MHENPAHPLFNQCWNLATPEVVQTYRDNLLDDPEFADGWTHGRRTPQLALHRWEDDIEPTPFVDELWARRAADSSI